MGTKFCIIQVQGLPPIPTIRICVRYYMYTSPFIGIMIQRKKFIGNGEFDLSYEYRISPQIKVILSILLVSSRVSYNNTKKGIFHCSNLICAPQLDKNHSEEQSFNEIIILYHIPGKISYIWHRWVVRYKQSLKNCIFTDFYQSKIDKTNTFSFTFRQVTLYYPLTPAIVKDQVPVTDSL